MFREPADLSYTIPQSPSDVLISRKAPVTSGKYTPIDTVIITMTLSRPRLHASGPLLFYKYCPHLVAKPDSFEGAPPLSSYYCHQKKTDLKLKYSGCHSPN